MYSVPAAEGLREVSLWGLKEAAQKPKPQIYQKSSNGKLSICLAFQLSPCCQELKCSFHPALNPSCFLYVSLQSALLPFLSPRGAAHKHPPTHLCQD